VRSSPSLTRMAVTKLWKLALVGREGDLALVLRLREVEHALGRSAAATISGCRPAPASGRRRRPTRPRRAVLRRAPSSRRRRRAGQQVRVLQAPERTRRPATGRRRRACASPPRAAARPARRCRRSGRRPRCRVLVELLQQRRDELLVAARCRRRARRPRPPRRRPTRARLAVPQGGCPSSTPASAGASSAGARDNGSTGWTTRRDKGQPHHRDWVFSSRSGCGVGNDHHGNSPPDPAPAAEEEAPRGRAQEGSRVPAASATSWPRPEEAVRGGESIRLLARVLRPVRTASCTGSSTSPAPRCADGRRHAQEERLARPRPGPAPARVGGRPARVPGAAARRGCRRCAHPAARERTAWT
jgi:hypothetical protein